MNVSIFYLNNSIIVTAIVTIIPIADKHVHMHVRYSSIFVTNLSKNAIYANITFSKQFVEAVQHS